MRERGTGKWHIKGIDGFFDITLAGRAFAYDFGSPEEAVRAIKRSRRYEKGDTITVEDESGIRKI